MSTIWIDADACPRVLKDILFRSAIRLHRPLILVAHQALQIPPSEWIPLVFNDQEARYETQDEAEQVL